VKNGVFYTAPASMVLIGITRLKVMECLVKLNFRIAEEAISVDRIGQFDAVFLTGTSPKVLPVVRIGNLNYSASNPSVLALIDEYNRMINNYIENKRR
jgi:branched-chain amino acid aminotransferase